MCCTFQKKDTTVKSSPSITPTSITEKNIVSPNTTINNPSTTTAQKEVEFNEKIQQPHLHNRDDEKETIQSSDQEEDDDVQVKDASEEDATLDDQQSNVSSIEYNLTVSSINIYMCVYS